MQVVGIGANNPEAIRIIECVSAQDPSFEFLGFVDNDPNKQGKHFYKYPVFTPDEVDELCSRDEIRFVNLITRDCPTRYETSLALARRGAQFTNLLFPTVNRSMVELGTGNYIQEGVLLQAAVSIGNNSSLHMAALIGHETKIGHSVFIAHGCNLSGIVTVEDGVFMGAGVTVMPRLTIGAWSIIGAGTVVIRDVPPHSVVVGNPGRVIKQTPRRHRSGDPLNAPEPQEN